MYRLLARRLRRSRFRHIPASGLVCEPWFSAKRLMLVGGECATSKPKRSAFSGFESSQFEFSLIATESALLGIKRVRLKTSFWKKAHFFGTIGLFPLLFSIVWRDSGSRWTVFKKCTFKFDRPSRNNYKWVIFHPIQMHVRLQFCVYLLI